jgi:hypothetical protein
MALIAPKLTVYLANNRRYVVPQTAQLLTALVLMELTAQTQSANQTQQ